MRNIKIQELESGEAVLLRYEDGELVESCVLDADIWEAVVRYVRGT